MLFYKQLVILFHTVYVAEIMTQLGESVPELETIADIIKDLALQERQEDNKDNLHIIEVTLPMLCRFAFLHVTLSVSYSL